MHYRGLEIAETTVSQENTELERKVNSEGAVCMPYKYNLSLFINRPEAEKCLQ